MPGRGGVVGVVSATARPLRFRRLPTAQVASRRVPVAVTFLSRLLGLALLAPERAGEGLLIPRCRSVHTFGMRFAIQVVFVDAANRPLADRGAVGPNRVLRERRAAGVVELPCPQRRGRLDAADLRARGAGGRLRGRRADPRAALRPPRGGSLSRPARDLRVGCPAAVPLQAARSAAARPAAARRARASTCCGRFALPRAPPGISTRSFR